MPFDAALIGRAWGPLDWQATPRRILAFRAGLAPEDAAPLDDTADLHASPLHCVTPEWTMSLALRADAAGTLTEAEARRGVHAGQDSRFHRRPQAGETVKVTAELLGARQSRAGVVSTLRQTGTGEDGALLWETLSSSVYRDVTLTGSGPEGPPRPDYGADLTGADETPVRLSAGLPHVYSECADIWNPIHTERAVALAAGLPDIIVHGTALWALAGLALIEAHAGGDERRLARLACAFVGQALPGQTAQLRHRGIGGEVGWRLESAAGAPLAVGRAQFRPA